jgi:hypothetical protein
MLRAGLLTGALCSQHTGGLPFRGLDGILHNKMERIEHFVPGSQEGELGVLARLRWPIPGLVARAYVLAYTEPDEMVLVPYCQGPSAIREILGSGRRAVALNFDPLLALVVETALDLPPARDLDAAVARLGDSLKQEIPLRRYLDGLYASTCPACLRPAVADYFIWDREQGAPIAKQLSCPACAWDGQAAVDAEDRERLAEVPARGMHYHYVLDRVAPQPQSVALRARLEQLLELYSPRNLYALAELTLKIESIFPEGPLQEVLKVLLADCLDRCSSLVVLPGHRARRRGLSRPARFLERNVWHAFESAVARFQALAAKPVAGLVGSLEAYREAAEEAAGVVGQGLVRDLGQNLPPRSLRLILVSPPALDSAVWSLSYLWSAWLLGAEAAAPLRPLLRQRTPDLAWYARVMAGSFRTLGSLLRDDGRIVVILSGQRPALVEALVVAAGQARLGMTSLVQGDSDYRLELAPTFPPAALGTDDARRTAVEGAIETIRMWGQPVPWRSLHAAVLARLVAAGLLGRASGAEDRGPSAPDWVAEQITAALHAAAFVRLPGPERGQELWWLAHPTNLAPPLCDRVESEAHQILRDALALTRDDFAAMLYARFPGTFTPDGDLVTSCLESYGYQASPDYWQLRREDVPASREAERSSMIRHLMALGRKLGYRASPREPFDVAWLEGQQARAVFVVRWQAAVAEALAMTGQAAAARPYLLIPGGRAALVSYKLAHNPLWQQQVDEAGWRFIKYRHVRQLVAQPEVDEYALRTIIGLDPIVERERAQLPLF